MKSLIKIIMAIAALLLILPLLIDAGEYYVMIQVGNFTTINLTNYFIEFAKLNVTHTSVEEIDLLSYINPLLNFLLNHFLIVILAAFFVVLAHAINDMV